jgi:hypothetical protein
MKDGENQSLIANMQMEKLEVSRQKKNNMLVIMFDSQFKNKII